MARIETVGEWNLKHQIKSNLRFAKPEYKQVAQVGDTVHVVGSLDIEFVVAEVDQKGDKILYTPVAGSVIALSGENLRDPDSSEGQLEQSFRNLE